MADYIIKGIPEDVMRDFKTACAWFKRSMRADLLASMGVTIHKYQAGLRQAHTKREIFKYKG